MASKTSTILIVESNYLRKYLGVFNNIRKHKLGVE